MLTAEIKALKGQLSNYEVEGQLKATIIADVDDMKEACRELGCAFMQQFSKQGNYFYFNIAVKKGVFIFVRSR